MIQQKPNPLRQLLTPIKLVRSRLYDDRRTAVRGEERRRERALEGVRRVVEHRLGEEASVQVDHDLQVAKKKRTSISGGRQWNKGKGGEGRDVYIRTDSPVLARVKVAYTQRAGVVQLLAVGRAQIRLQRRRERHLPDLLIEVQYELVAGRLRAERSLSYAVEYISGVIVLQLPNCVNFR